MSAPTNEELRRLLDLAAKAVGKDIDQDRYDEDWGFAIRHSSKWWAPHIDDGDSRRLAVALGIAVTPYPIFSMPKHSVIAKLHRNTDQIGVPNPTEVVEAYGDDPCAATRLAVLRVAAAIGKEMP